MNTSNPFGTETIARQRQAEIDKNARQGAWIRGERPRHASVPLKRKLTLALASLGLKGLVGGVLATLLH